MVLGGKESFKKDGKREEIVMKGEKG